MPVAIAIKLAMRSAAVSSDKELIAEVLGGKTAAFAELTSRYRDKVERLCRRFFSDREMARDLVQESFIRAFAGLASYRSEMAFGGWLRAITANACYDELRRRKHRPEELVADFSEPELLSLAAWMVTVVSGASRVSEPSGNWMVARPVWPVRTEVPASSDCPVLAGWYPLSLWPTSTGSVATRRAAGDEMPEEACATKKK